MFLRGLPSTGPSMGYCSAQCGLLKSLVSSLPLFAHLMIACRVAIRNKTDAIESQCAILGERHSPVHMQFPISAIYDLNMISCRACRRTHAQHGLSTRVIHSPLPHPSLLRCSCSLVVRVVSNIYSPAISVGRNGTDAIEFQCGGLIHIYFSCVS